MCNDMSFFFIGYVNVMGMWLDKMLYTFTRILAFFVFFFCFVVLGMKWVVLHDRKMIWV